MGGTNHFSERFSGCLHVGLFTAWVASQVPDRQLSDVTFKLRCRKDA